MPVRTNEDPLYSDCNFSRRPAGLPWLGQVRQSARSMSPKKDIMLLHRGDCSKSRPLTPDNVTLRVSREF